jgi:RND family efflux transporter MFP subunit
LCLLLAPILAAQGPELVKVIAKTVERSVRLPGEFAPYQRVNLYSRVTAFVDKVHVDRGSVVKEGLLLVSLSAPEMAAQLAEAEAKAQAVALQHAEAAAKLASAESTYQKMKAASATPGAIAGNELVTAEKGVDAARALVRALESSAQAARASAGAIKELAGYLQVKAPFDGVITERWVHPGALVGPGAAAPLLSLEQNSRLRLVVAVPEAHAGAVARGAAVPFTVPAYPGEMFRGVIARSAQALDPKTRTMAVEVDVANPGGRLASGMFPEVQWPVRKPRASLLVPPAAVVVTTERMFVIRSRQGKAEWVTVSRGAAAGDLVEVLGPLQPGDEIVKRASDEIREGTMLKK